jgi:hypothetical protein
VIRIVSGSYTELLSKSKRFFLNFAVTSKHPRMLENHFRKFWQNFSKPYVFVFILIGTGVIFLTFLTNDNALEIAISGFASVFIGIGVNNYTSSQTHYKDERIIKRKAEHALQLLKITEDKITCIKDEMIAGDNEEAQKDFRELTEYIHLLKQLLIDEESLN